MKCLLIIRVGLNADYDAFWKLFVLTTYFHHLPGQMATNSLHEALPKPKLQTGPFPKAFERAVVVVLRKRPC